jgi:hypothetical protein
MTTAALLTRPAQPATATKTCYDASCNWAHSSTDKCECACGGHGHGGAYRPKTLCACGDIAGECFC